MDLKNFLPPVLTDFIRNNRQVKKYKTYEEAFSQCTLNAYENEELCNMIADKTLAHIESLKQKPFTFNPTTIYLAFALNYFVNRFDKKSITILDFGGACGAHFFEIRNIIPKSILLKWIVVETAQMIRSANSRSLGNDDLIFTSSIENISIPVDFIHSSGTLQYVPEPFDFLKKLIDKKAKMILFNRMMFNRGSEDIITVQRSLLSLNGPGKLPWGYADKPIKYPHTTISITKIEAEMKKGSYECISDFDEKSGILPLGKEEVVGKGLLFLHQDF